MANIEELLRRWFVGPSPTEVPKPKKTTMRIRPYSSADWDSDERFCCYWHQIKEIVSLAPEKVLDVGIGDGFVSTYLKAQQYRRPWLNWAKKVDVSTVDVDKRLNPDRIGSVLEIPFSDSSFDVVTCCELLEHLPYNKFSKALSELFRVSKSYVVLSLPDCSPCRESSIAHRIRKAIRKIRKVRSPGDAKKPGLDIRERTLPEMTEAGYFIEHCWEIGRRAYPLPTITEDIGKAGFKIEKTYRVAEFPYHRFFVLRKCDNSGSLSRKNSAVYQDHRLPNRRPPSSPRKSPQDRGTAAPVDSSGSRGPSGNRHQDLQRLAAETGP